MTDVVVRRFLPDDWSTLRDVRLAALLDAPYAFLSTYAEAGERVKQGAVLARIEDGAIRDAALSARSGVRSAQASLEPGSMASTARSTFDTRYDQMFPVLQPGEP